MSTPDSPPILATWHNLALRVITFVLPVTLLSIVLAVSSVALHQHLMRDHLPEEAWRLVTDPILELTLVAPLTLIPPLLFAAGALWFVNREVVRPLRRLEVKAAALTWGDYEAIAESVGGIAEIQRLQRELVEMAQRVRAAQEGLRDYIGAITTAQEEERTRLARELHDDTLQAIIALKQRLQLTRKAVQDSHACRPLAELETLVEQTIENLRRITRALRPIYLEDLGLVTALEMLARETAQNRPLVVEFRSEGNERRLGTEVELSLFRIAQEALNNAVKHACAQKVVVTFAFAENYVELAVSDDGIGFLVPSNPMDLAPKGHFGLLGMHERAALIGARLKIESKPGSGTRLSVRL